jgi:hypothetical protein
MPLSLELKSKPNKQKSNLLGLLFNLEDGGIIPLKCQKTFVRLCSITSHKQNCCISFSPKSMGYFLKVMKEK